MRKKLVKITIVAIMLIWACATVVNAFSFTVTMTPSKTNVAEESEFSVTIKVSNLDVGQNGINALSGFLKYDSEIFEPISDSNIHALNTWSPSFNPDNGRLTLTKMTFVKSEEAVFEISFKTKSGTSGKTGEISFENIFASNNVEDITTADISTRITVGTPGGSNSNNNTTENNIVENNTITNNTVENNVVENNTVNNNVVPIIPNTNRVNNTLRNNIVRNNVVRNNVARNNTLSNYSVYRNTANNDIEEDIPYTGVEDTVMYIIIVLLALSVIFYVKYQKINIDIK